MSEVKIQGVDGIKFDDTYIDGQKRNLALGKDTRPFKDKYKLFYDTMLPLIISCFLLFMSFTVMRTFTVPLMLLSLMFIFIWRRKRRKYFSGLNSMFDKPKYVGYDEDMSLLDFAPKELLGDVKDEAKKKGEELGKGVYFFGHELFTEQEIHAEDSKVRTHIIIFGTTGSGKTENILSICVNFLTQSSGFILVDGKGDTLLFAKTFSLCRAFGRTDDLYLLNFMDFSTKEKSVEVITNTFNFFVDSTEKEANEIVGGLLPDSGGGGSGVWEGRAATGIASLNEALYYLKDNGYLEIDPDTYRSYFFLDKFVELSMDENIPKEHRVGLHSVLGSINYKLPDDKNPEPQQQSATEEQFQYIVMQYTQTFNMLAGEYSHITVSQVPDISITDIVLRRRILLVLLPSLAKSEQSVRNLGRIIIAMTRNVSSKAIGNRVEGDIKTTIESKPTAAISSYALIFDEFGAYATKGASTLPAQVRSLNMVCLFAGQDYEAFKKGDEIEAATIFANCTIKICMKLECNLTFEKFRESAGKKFILVQESFETRETAFGKKHVPAETSRVEQRDTLALPDMKDQGPGMETILYGSQTYRTKAFYADPVLAKKARVNHMLEIRRPKHPTIQAMRNGVDNLHRRLKDRLEGDWESDERMAVKSISAFYGYHDELLSVFDQVNTNLKDASESEKPNDTELSIFAISSFLKKVELIDHKVNKSLHSSLGYEFDGEFDDEYLLAGENNDDAKDWDEIDDESTQSSGAEVPEISNKKKSVDDAELDRLDRFISKRKKKLAEAESASFNSLEAINMSVFNVQKGIQKLDELLLRKEGYDVKDASRMSALASSNLVVEMGLGTNPAAVSEKERRRKSPSVSSKQVQEMVSRFSKEGVS